MSSARFFVSLMAVVIISFLRASSAEAYTEDFDDLNAASRWTTYKGVGFDSNLQPKPIDTNFDRLPVSGGVNGVVDDLSGFAFDYSTVGIPSATNSVGGSTIGLKLQADLFSNALGGFSASPNGLNLTGNYKVSFDAWSNTVGPFPSGGSGSTNLSTFGILTSGSFSQSILSSDGVFFAYSADGESSADIRAYSVEDTDSYNATPTEPHATYHAGTRNVPGSAGGLPGGGVALYNSAFGTGRTAPTAQVDLFGPLGSDTSNQSGTLNSGAAGFAWHHHEILKIGNIVEWSVNSYLLITVDTTNFALPIQGGNISFGHADVNFTSSTSPADQDLIFTLIDNIVATPEPSSLAMLGIGLIGVLTGRRR